MISSLLSLLVSKMKRIALLLVILTAIAANNTGWAQESTQSVTTTDSAQRKSVSQVPPVRYQTNTETRQSGVDWPQVGMGVTVAVGNLFYIPAKIAYGTLGGVAGGAAYVFDRGDRRTAYTIWRNSLGGDYVLTPAMVTGQEPLHFMGPDAVGQRRTITVVSTSRSVPLQEAKLTRPQPAVNPIDTSNRATPVTGRMDGQQGARGTLEIPSHVNGSQNGSQDRSTARPQRVAPSMALRTEPERMPQMSIEPQ
jgi:hypothetical protein